MVLCKMIDQLYRRLPLPFLRGWLLRCHVDRCSACQGKLLSRKGAESLIVQSRDLRNSDDLWPAIMRKMDDEEGRGAANPSRLPNLLKWVSAAVVFLTVVLAGLWLMKAVLREEPVIFSPPAEGFVLDYVRIGGEPANAVIYRPKDSGMIIIWAEKSF